MIYPGKGLFINSGGHKKETYRSREISEEVAEMIQAGGNNAQDQVWREDGSGEM